MRTLLLDVLRHLNPSLSADALSVMLETWHAAYLAAVAHGEEDAFHADLEALLS